MNDIKLGQLVRFKTDYVKTNEYVDANEITEELVDIELSLDRLKPRKHNGFKEGYICGKRHLVVKSYLQYDVERYNEYSENRYYFTGQDYETFYLVACDFKGLAKVKAEDLEFPPFPLPF